MTFAINIPNVPEQGIRKPMITEYFFGTGACEENSYFGDFEDLLNKIIHRTTTIEYIIKVP